MSISLHTHTKKPYTSKPKGAQPRRCNSLEVEATSREQPYILNPILYGIVDPNEAESYLLWEAESYLLWHSRPEEAPGNTASGRG
ncbi:predicted protein [Pyrenophora tritici-repentis Pt-1C-BFP]|uniref:Uncharacterized protein n=1 Tax=Pyrenophora tritici-repentis (strain Pt-1C-BFP) TaxID=426418 RepID=B2W8C4_PYRTR|nr:uncharacterized protein PTRG_06232 [Pyrenophora tritici-repentis Pt-1C-BFP]EDU49152.1 predicted protein [Pyrenophora tritici-repentis Pt-1C-BFP]